MVGGEEERVHLGGRGKVRWRTSRRGRAGKGVERIVMDGWNWKERGG